jgi:hypothetical protein
MAKSAGAKLKDGTSVANPNHSALPFKGNGNSASKKVQGRQTHSQREGEGPHFTSLTFGIT